MQIENDLIIKLFSTYHLNTEERKLLPNGEVNIKTARSVISIELNKYGWFPGRKEKVKGNTGGEFLQIEKKENSIYTLHINFEFRYLNYEHKELEFQSEINVINDYISKRIKEGLGGVSVNWKK